MPERYGSRTDRPPTSTSAWLVQLLVVGAAIAAVAGDEVHTMHTLGVHEAPKVLIVFLLWFIGATLGNIVVHELGHLAAAKLAGLPVTHVSLLPSGGEFAQVRFVMQPSRALLPARAILTTLSGPLVNLAGAAVFLYLADRPGTSQLWHGGFLVGAIVGAGLGIRNLIPTGRVRGLRNDGTQAMLWTFQPSRMRRELVTRQQTNLLASYGARLRQGGIPDLKVLRSLVDGPDPVIAARAAPVLMIASPRAGQAELATDAARLLAAARNPQLTAAGAADLAGKLAWCQSIALIGETSRARLNAPDADALARTAEAAEYGLARDPARPIARYALAMVRCLQDQPKAARELLVTVDLDSLTPADRANTLVVRALAELDLGDLAQARRLIEAARRDSGGYKGLLPLVEQVLAAHERRQNEA